VTKATPESGSQWSKGSKRARVRRRFGPMTYAALIIGAAIFIRVVIVVIGALSPPPDPAPPTQSVRYLGVYVPGVPGSYAGVDQLTQAIGRQPNLVLYYSHWRVPFDVHFATVAAEHGAVTIVQIAPNKISLASIVSGRYDDYLRSYALAVKAFRHPVILSFGHEMNGDWYSWGYRHTSPKVFVAAWRHIVTLFRQEGARNVKWMWTVNIIGQPNRAPNPAPWWPGRSYVTWVGIDGYYRTPSIEFSSVFGQTIADVRELTPDPILIAETAAEASADQSAKIADLFAGIETFGLLGFVWFDQDNPSFSQPGEIQYWRLSPAALAAFRRDVKVYMKPLANSAPERLHPLSGSSSP
jgi:mannan endo-1,4-beta-mannosidase